MGGKFRLQPQCWRESMNPLIKKQNMVLSPVMDLLITYLFWPKDAGAILRRQRKKNEARLKVGKVQKKK